MDWNQSTMYEQRVRFILAEPVNDNGTLYGIN